MEISRNDFELGAAYGLNHLSKKKKKKLVLAKATTSKAPAAITANGVPMVKTKTLTKKQAKKAKRKALVSKVKKGVKKAVKTVAKVSKSLALAPMLAPLIPLKPIMKKALQKKGFPAPKKTQDLAEAFFNNIVRGRANFETSYLEYDGYNDNLVTVEIVGGIIKFIKDVLVKKKAKTSGAVEGVQLSPVEELIADGSEKVLAKIEEKADKAGVELEPMPGSNAKENSTSGMSEPDDKSEAEDKSERKEKRKKKGGVSGGAISLGSMTTPLIIGGVLVAAYVAFK